MGGAGVGLGWRLVYGKMAVEVLYIAIRPGRRPVFTSDRGLHGRLVRDGSGIEPGSSGTLPGIELGVAVHLPGARQPAVGRPLASRLLAAALHYEKT